MKAGEHGPDELYDKFTVVKSKNVRLVEFEEAEVENRKIFNESDELTHNGEFIFVLRPEANDLAAVAALVEYAKVCKSCGYPQLSDQIMDKVEPIMERYSN